MTTFLGSIVSSNVTQTVMAVIKRQVYVILDVNRVGKEFLAKKVYHLTESLINNLNDLAAHLYLRKEITFFNIVDVFL